MRNSRTASVPPIIRSAHPLAFAAFLEHIGAPVDRYLCCQELSDLRETPDAFVPLQRAWALFDDAARGEDPMLGWHVGRFVGDHGLNLGLLRKLEHAPTLLKALHQIVRLSWTEASHLQLGIQERRDDILICTHYSGMKGVRGYASSQAYQLGVFVGLIRHFVGQQWMPDEIGIEYPTVPVVTKEIFPGTRILPRQSAGYVAIPRSCLHQAPPCDGCEDSDSFKTPDKFDYGATLAALLEPYLASGGLSESLAASLMDTSLSTLKRRLSASGTTYRVVVDELRFKRAKELLEDTDAQIIDVASAVGFDDPSHFANMFRRVSGLSPREFRKNMRQIVG